MNKTVLKASAGTGKTYRLSIEYIVALLKGSSYKEILVLTFTKKATGEIRERIFQFIDEILTKKTKSLVDSIEEKLLKELPFDELSSIYKEMIKNKDSIKIYTIDSFINQIFKKIIGPNLNIYSYEMINEEKNKEYYQFVLNEIIKDKKHFSELKSFFSDNSQRKIENYHKFISSFIEERWKLSLIKKEKRLPFSYDKPHVYIKMLIENLTELKAKKESLFKHANPEAITTNVFKPLYSMDKNDWDPYILNNLSDVLKGNNFFNGVNVKPNSKDSDEVKNLIEISKEIFQKFKEDLSRYLYQSEIIPLEEHLFEFGNYCSSIYDKQKLSDKKFTFNDMSYYTYTYFNNPELSLSKDGFCTDYLYDILESTINTVFIDEFQDTSIIQWSILKVFVNSAVQVICVGDEKQSIYSWRGGEKRLFEQLENIINGNAESMNKSYRSYGEIINFVNRYFLSISNSLDDFSWNYSPVEYLSTKEGGFVETHFLGSEDEESSERVISILKNVKNYSKTAILARSKIILNEISEKLEMEGIPYINSDNLCITEHKAIKGLYSLLKYLYYDEYIYLLEFMRSDIVNIDSSELKNLLINKTTIEKELNSNGDLFGNKYLQFVQSLKNKRTLAHEYDILAEKLFKTLGLSKKFTKNSDLKNIYKFFEIFKSFNNIGQLIDYIEENKEDEALKQVAVEELNAVTLMTIHKSKGLEYETVIYLIKNSRKPPQSSLKLYTELNDSFDFCPNYFYTSSKHLKTLSSFGFSFEEIEKIREDSEEINTIYVALTRPKRNLFVIYEDRAKNVKPTTALSALIKAMDVETFQELDYKSVGSFVESDFEVNQSEHKNSIDFFNFFATNNYDKNEIVKNFNLANNTNYSLDKEFKRKIGSATHYFFENITYATHEEIELSKKLTRSRYGNMFGEELTESIFEKALTIIQKFNWVFSKNYQIQKEFEIFDGEKTFRIDRLVIDSERKKVWIVDYKTGGKDDSQLENYKNILEKQLGNEYLIETMFLFV